MFIAVFGSVAAALIFDQSPPLVPFALIMVGWGTLWGGIMVHNDYTDLVSDSKNRPHKAIPSGAISPSVAHWGGMAMMVAGAIIVFLASIPLDPYPLTAYMNGFWALTLFLVGFFYNYWGKNWGVVGHMLVGWGVAIIPFFGVACISPVTGAWTMAPLLVALFICEIGREIIVCAGDYYGDLEQGWRTVPVRLGRRASMLTVPIFFLGFVPFYAIPYFGWFDYGPTPLGPIYFWGYTIFIIGLYLCWAVIYWTMTHTRDEKRVWRAFEVYARTGTRLFIIFTEFVLLAEAFF